MNKMISRKEAAKILRISITALDQLAALDLFLTCSMLRTAAFIIPKRLFRNMLPGALTVQSHWRTMFQNAFGNPR